jgi:nitrate/TMAO reductase-like tetraheme cytochrome c subunit
VFGLTGVLIALAVLTIMLAGVFLVRPSITAGVTGKILAFVGLCVLPILCIGAGMSFHMQRSQDTSSCISCHSMASHGQSLHLEDPKYIPAQHFQNHLVPPDKACYTCHTDYTIYGPWKSRLDGLRYVYMTYFGKTPKTIHLNARYSNLQCLHCHAGARNFEEHLNQMPPIGELTSNRISCISSGCHDMIHNVSEVGHLKMWTEGAPSTSVASGASSTETAGASKAPTGGAAGNATTAAGKGIFDSQGCGACHGAGGGGGTGPALTHIL